MPEFVVIGNPISVASVRNYIYTHKINKGDSLLFNPGDYDHIVEEIKNSEEPVDIPLNILEVLIIKDTGGDVPHGKVQIVKNEKA